MFVAGALAGDAARLGHLARQRLGVDRQRAGEDLLLQFLHVREALRPLAVADAADAAHHLGQALQQQITGPVGENMLRSFWRKLSPKKCQPEIMKAMIAGKKNRM